jgi:hypothetical protein
LHVADLLPRSVQSLIQTARDHNGTDREDKVELFAIYQISLIKNTHDKIKNLLVGRKFSSRYQLASDANPDHETTGDIIAAVARSRAKPLFEQFPAMVWDLLVTSLSNAGAFTGIAKVGALVIVMTIMEHDFMLVAHSTIYALVQGSVDQESVDSIAVEFHASVVKQQSTHNVVVVKKS